MRTCPFLSTQPEEQTHQNPWATSCRNMMLVADLPGLRRSISKTSKENAQTLSGRAWESMRLCPTFRYKTNSVPEGTTSSPTPCQHATTQGLPPPPFHTSSSDLPPQDPTRRGQCFQPTGATGNRPIASDRPCCPMRTSSRPGAPPSTITAGQLHVDGKRGTRDRRSLSLRRWWRRRRLARYDR